MIKITLKKTDAIKNLMKDFEKLFYFGKTVMSSNHIFNVYSVNRGLNCVNNRIIW